MREICGECRFDCVCRMTRTVGEAFRYTSYSATETLEDALQPAYTRGR